MAFPGINIWFSHVMSSLCRKPKLISSLYAILCTANVVSHTDRYERKLEKQRAKNINMSGRLLRGENIWNLCVIDNIDMKETTFAYDNIYDTTRRTAHATLRMVFQFELPRSLSNIAAEYNLGSEFEFEVGMSDFTNHELRKYENIFNTFLDFNSDGSIHKLWQEIKKDIRVGSQVALPNVVILEPGENPCNDENVHNAARMYYDNVGLDCNGHLYLACDESIFRRLVKLHETQPEINLILGGWHTSRIMCTTLLRIFSGYGIFNLAAKLGVMYLEKLEKAVDYVATCRVLELIWIAVGSALCQYSKNCNISMNDIINHNNNVVKVWYLFFCWTGLWIGHKLGIRYGNYEMQVENLSAFAPLFPVVRHSNYAQSVTYFLTFIKKNSTLQQILRYVCSVNLTRPSHFFAFDEALERFGVKFVKQNIGSSFRSPEDLKSKIMSIQTEQERLNLLLSEYVNEHSLIPTDRVTKSREEALQNLINQLVEAFHLSDPIKHQLFEDTSQNTDQGFQNLFECYDCGIERLKSIYRQDIKKSEKRNTSGRCAQNIIVDTYSQQQKRKEEQKKLLKKRKSNN